MLFPGLPCAGRGGSEAPERRVGSRTAGEAAALGGRQAPTGRARPSPCPACSLLPRWDRVWAAGPEKWGGLGLWLGIVLLGAGRDPVGQGDLLAQPWGSPTVWETAALAHLVARIK